MKKRSFLVKTNKSQNNKFHVHSYLIIANLKQTSIFPQRNAMEPIRATSFRSYVHGTERSEGG
jgi:hypothetical protein